jgi:hypothetical protein
VTEADATAIFDQRDLSWQHHFDLTLSQGGNFVLISLDYYWIWHVFNQPLLYFPFGVYHQLLFKQFHVAFVQVKRL